MAKNEFSLKSKLSIIMDDESYFPFDRSKSVGYYSNNKENVPDEIKFHQKSKYEKKLCVWIAISEYGHSTLYFIPANCALNSEKYANECVRKRLNQFIDKFHSDGDYLFWPDGASSHYAKNTVNVLTELGIKFVDRDDNPPNVPQLRPIERFWAHLKASVYQNGWKADDYNQLKTRIRLKLKKFDTAYFERLMSGTKDKVCTAAKKGPLAVINR